MVFEYFSSIDEIDFESEGPAYTFIILRHVTLFHQMKKVKAQHSRGKQGILHGLGKTTS